MLLPRAARHLIPIATAIAAGCAPTTRTAPPPSPPPPPYAALRAPPPVDREAPLRRAMLVVHDAARRTVGLPALSWSDRLAADARRHAAYLARTGRFDHAPQEAEGENLWAGTRGAFRYEQMAGDWVSERRRFRNRATLDYARTGHYSQIVWRETTALGCALATGTREDVLVCRYAPRGNWIGEAAY